MVDCLYINISKVTVEVSATLYTASHQNLEICFSHHKILIIDSEMDPKERL